MSKHDRAKQEKQARNRIYALRYRQLECKVCKHRSCRRGRCIKCGAEPKHRKVRKQIK